MTSDVFFFQFALENRGISTVLLKLLGPEDRLSRIISGSAMLDDIKNLLRPILQADNIRNVVCVISDRSRQQGN